MPTIGLDNMVYSKITEGSNGEEIYGAVKKLAKSISVDLSVELLEAILYADDGASDAVKEFKKGTLGLGVDDIGNETAADLLGVAIDTNGAVVSTAEDVAPYAAIGFRAKKPNGKYRYFWLYRVKFGIPGTTLATKGDSISFQTPKIEGTVMRRNKVDGRGKHPWKIEITEGETGVVQTAVDAWFDTVYEPAYTDLGVRLSNLAIGSVSLTPTFDTNTTEYTASTSNATNTITATAADNTAAIVVAVNGNSLTNGSAASWNNGENTVVITVTKGSSSKTYTVTVTKG